jgi:hypothetical protein
MPRVSPICPRWDIRCPVSDSRLRATPVSPRLRRNNRRSAQPRAGKRRRVLSDGELSRYGGGGPLRPYTRSGGAPNCAPSLRSVAGLLCRSLAAAYEDPLPLPSEFVAKAVIGVAPLVALLSDGFGAFSRTCSLIHGTSRARNCTRARLACSHPRLCAGARRASLGKSVRKWGRSAHTRGAERRCVTDLCSEVRVSSQALLKASARRRPATEQSEGA